MLGGRRTFAILARKKERTRNLNRSSSVCRMTSVKFDFGSIVPVISSMVSIYTIRGQHRRFAITLYALLYLTYLLLYSVHDSFNQAWRVWEEFWRCTFVHPCSRQCLKVEGALRDRRRGDGGEDVLDVIVHDFGISLYYGYEVKWGVARTIE